MALQVTNLKRVFKLDKEILPDPNPQLSIEDVMQHYALKYPELTTSTVHGPTIEGEQAVYQFKTTVGTKG